MAITENNIVMGLGKIALGTGFIGLVWMVSPIPIMELIQFGLLVTLPIIGLAAALGLISHGTVQMIWNKELTERVNKFVKEKRAEKLDKDLVVG
jgi:hypothetical protein